ncbi:AraC family transcriptional regulator [Nocardioides aromaticivorans]|uniref:AraC family transcriptional regulator n=1 Tax=Nocardioides aromaticivorans TaxID=200618 RepID=A0ABX7PGN6_9ACTN|nr:helix-turn-helix domain-containing protein [Nocardioides aromaticivorans]QSR25101.1 AraC family transcriptional regulator [Nocardioides aromaticivorans]
MTTPTGRDRLRELLDAVLDEDNRTLDAMAQGAYASPYHFSRRLSRDAGEAPVAMRRRVMLERAAWRIRKGSSVTDAAWEAGYESVEGFSRAFSRAYGHPPSDVGETGSVWLPAANGIHFHPPTSLWVHSTEQAMNPVTDQQVRHDLDDTRALVEHAKGLSPEEWREVRAPGHQVASWEGPEESIAAVLERTVFAKEVWLAAVEGTEFPAVDRDPDPATLLARHDAVAGRWLAAVRDIDRRGGWDDLIIDALCEPPESFVLSSIVTHVLTYSAYRRLLVRGWLDRAGVDLDLDDGDPINWLRREAGEQPETGGDR